MAFYTASNAAIQRRRKIPASENARLSRLNFLFEHICLTVKTALVCLAFLVWLVAVSTDYWVVVIGDGVAGTPGILIKEIPSGHPIVSAANTQTGSHLAFLWSYSGLWRHCEVTTQAFNVTADERDFQIDPDVSRHVTSCRHHSFTATSSSKDEVQGHLSQGHPSQPSKDFVKAELCFVVVVLILMTLAVAFSVYALVHPRYMYKRVAGSLHLITSVTLIVLFGLVRSSEHLAHHQTHPHLLEKSRHFYGYSLLLAVAVLIVFLSAGFAFLCLSKKRRDLLYDSDVNLK